MTIPMDTGKTYQVTSYGSSFDTPASTIKILEVETNGWLKIKILASIPGGFVWREEDYYLNASAVACFKEVQIPG